MHVKCEYRNSETQPCIMPDSFSCLGLPEFSNFLSIKLTAGSWGIKGSFSAAFFCNNFLIFQPPDRVGYCYLIFLWQWLTYNLSHLNFEKHLFLRMKKSSLLSLCLRYHLYRTCLSVFRLQGALEWFPMVSSIAVIAIKLGTDRILLPPYMA